MGFGSLGPGLLVFLTFILSIFVAVHQSMDAHFDFGIFYYAAHMVLDGSGHALHSLDAQRLYQVRFHRPPDFLFLNPPFALLPLLDLAKLPIAFAFALWTMLSLALLVSCLKVLEIETVVKLENWPLLLSLTFLPIIAAFLHGTFAFVVLSSFVLTCAQWRKGRLSLGRLILAVATLKFQPVVGFVAILLGKRKWRELSGFATGFTLVFAVSALLTGLSELMEYPRLLHSTEFSYASMLYAMADWHGLASLVTYSHLSAQVVLLLSLATVGWAARGWTDLDHGFALAVLASMLVSYHFSPADLTLCLVPFFLAIKTGLLPFQKAPAIVMLGLLLPLVPDRHGAPVRPSGPSARNRT